MIVCHMVQGIVGKSHSQNKYSGYFVSVGDRQTANCKFINLIALSFDQVWWRYLSIYFWRVDFWERFQK